MREKEFELRHTQLAVEFAKYGFAGALIAAIVGMLVILALAIIDAKYEEFSFGTGDLAIMMLPLAVSCIAFGSFSLWQRASILAKFKTMSLEFKSTDGESESKGND